jgi:GNAT superfamily N-acetyltransferase
LELDDDRSRVDLDALFAYLNTESYWARERSRADVELGVRDAARVVGLYDAGRQVGFAREISDGVRASLLCDVYVLTEYRGRGLGVELVREAVDHSPNSALIWTLTTRDAHGLYAKFGFVRTVAGDGTERRIMRRERAVERLPAGARAAKQTR